MRGIRLSNLRCNSHKLRSVRGAPINIDTSNKSCLKVGKNSQPPVTCDHKVAIDGRIILVSSTGIGPVFAR